MIKQNLTLGTTASKKKKNNGTGGLYGDFIGGTGSANNVSLPNLPSSNPTYGDFINIPTPSKDKTGGAYTGNDLTLNPSTPSFGYGDALGDLSVTPKKKDEQIVTPTWGTGNNSKLPPSAPSGISKGDISVAPVDKSQFFDSNVVGTVGGGFSGGKKGGITDEGEIIGNPSVDNSTFNKGNNTVSSGKLPAPKAANDKAGNFSTALRDIIEKLFSNKKQQTMSYGENIPAQSSTETTAPPQDEQPKQNETVDKKTPAAPTEESNAEDGKMSYEDYINEMKKGYQEQLDAANKQAEQTKARAMADAENAYAQNKATYGTNAETLAQMGLTGGGYSDYLQAQAYAQKRADAQVAGAQEIASKTNAQATYQQYIQSMNEKLAEKALYEEQLKEQREYERQQLEEQRKYNEEQTANNKKQNIYDSLWQGVQDIDSGYTAESIDAICKEYGLSDEVTESLKNILKITQANGSNKTSKETAETSNQLLQQAIIDIKNGVADKDYIDTLKELGMTDEDYNKAIDYLNTYNKNKNKDDIKQTIDSGDLDSAESKIENGVKDGTIDKDTKYKGYYDIAIKDASNCKTIKDITDCAKRLATSKNAGNLTEADYANAIKYLYANAGNVLSSERYSIAYDKNIFGTELPNAACLKITLDGKEYKVETVQALVDDDTAKVLNGMCGGRVHSGSMAKIDGQIYIYRTYPKETDSLKNGWIKVKTYNFWTSAIGSDNKTFYPAFDKVFETQPAAKAPEHSAKENGTGGAWKSYDEAAKAGYSNIRTAREFNRNNNADKKKYGTYDKYLEAMYRKYVLNENA